MGWQPHKLDAGYYGKTAEQQIAFYQELLWHVLVQMNVLEMRAVCLLCGHYPLHNWAAPVVDRFNATFRDTQAFAGIEFHYPGEGPEVGGDHAAQWETSYLWYLRPDCVDMSVFLGRDDEGALGIYGTDPRRHGVCGAGPPWLRAHRGGDGAQGGGAARAGGVGVLRLRYAPLRMALREPRLLCTRLCETGGPSRTGRARWLRARPA